MKKTRKFIFDGLMLTCAALIMRTVSVAFNAYVSGKLGVAGMGLFSLVMSVYAFAVTFATGGINLAATRMTAEAMGRGSNLEIRRAMRRAIAYSLFFGTLGGVLLYTGSDYFGSVLMGDERTVPSLRLLSFGLPCLSVGSALNGYFTAVRRVVKNAACQFFEQACKIGFTVAGFALFLDRGLEWGCLALVGASMIAECTSCLLSLILYLHDLHAHNDRTGAPGKALTGSLCSIALPVAVSALFRSGLVTAEHMAIPRGLRINGASADGALASYGVIQGMVLPVVLYPTAFLGAFSSLLVPEFAEELTAGHRARTSHIATKAIGATMLFSIGAAGVMMCYSDVLGEMLYKNAECGFYIRLLGALVPVMYLDGVVDSMLKGMGYQFYSMVVNIVDSALSLVLVILLVPRMGVKGYVITIFIGEVLNYALSLTKLLAHERVQMRIVTRVVKPILCIVGATCISRLTGRLLGAGVYLQMALCLPVYLLLLICTFAVSYEDATWFLGLFSSSECKKLPEKNTEIFHTI